MGRRVVLGGLILVTFVRCGIDESGLALGDASLLIDGNGVDASSDGPVPSDAKPDVPAPPVEAGVCDDDANGCTPPEVPPGWSPVAYVENPQTGCPATSWTTQDDYVTNIGNGNATCACTCTKTSDPNCTTGTIATFFSSAIQTCGATGASLTFADGGCLAVNGNLSTYYASTALAPTGSGSCTVQTTAAGAIQTTPARLCIPDPQCTSAACDGKSPTGFAACIVSDGDQACPNGSSFNVKHAVAKSAASGCAPTCGTACTVAGTCDNPQVEFFSQDNCTNALATLASDTSCVPTKVGGQNAQGATYTATPDFKCNATGTTSVQVQLTTARTVCCRP